MSVVTARTRVLQATVSSHLGPVARQAGAGWLRSRRVLEQIVSRGGHEFSSAEINRAFDAARAGNPALTPRQFVRIATGRARQRLQQFLGEAQFVLESQIGGAAWVRAWKDTLDSWRHMPPPADFGHSYGHWDANLSALTRPEPRTLLPMDFPVFTDGVPHYPQWSTASTRAHQIMAHIQLSRWLPHADFALDIPDADLIGHLRNLGDARVAYRSEMHPALIQTPTQVAFTRSTGFAPIISWERMNAEQARRAGFRVSNTAGSRQAQEARFEFATRLRAAGENRFMNALDADKLRADPTLGAALTSSHDPDNWSPFARLPIDELRPLATGDPSSPLFALHGFEIEHHIPERTARRLERIYRALDGNRVTQDLANQIRMLTGHCDAANVHLVTPYEHGRLDGFAAVFMGQNNLQRVNDYSNLVFRNFAGQAPTLHTDFRRVDSPFIAMEPQRLIEVVEAIRPRFTAGALDNVDAAGRVALRDLIPEINRALQYYGRSDLYFELPWNIVLYGVPLP